MCSTTAERHIITPCHFPHLTLKPSSVMGEEKKSKKEDKEEKKSKKEKEEDKKSRKDEEKKSKKGRSRSLGYMLLYAAPPALCTLI